MYAVGSDSEVSVSELLFELPIQEMLYELFSQPIGDLGKLGQHPNMGKISALQQTAGENFPEKAKKHPQTPEKRVLVEIIISPFPNYSSSLISFGNALQVNSEP